MNTIWPEQILVRRRKEWKERLKTKAEHGQEAIIPSVLNNNGTEGASSRRMQKSHLPFIHSINKSHLEREKCTTACQAAHFAAALVEAISPKPTAQEELFQLEFGDRLQKFSS
ncbi:hypothetical protein CB1_000538023 [Camelus ferus]|nr:hypothetical protein CB1_000538023 [Camelus ferus]